MSSISVFRILFDYVCWLRCDTKNLVIKESQTNVTEVCFEEGIL